MRQLKIDVLSVLVVTDKLDFFGQLADETSAEFRVPEGRQPLDRGAAASAAEPRVWYKY